MSTRSKLKSLLRRHKDESDTSPGNASTQSPRHEIASQGQTTQAGQRPVSSSVVPNPASPARSLSGRLRRQSVDRRSQAGTGTGTGTGRSSVDASRKSLDRHVIPTTDGSIPSVPVIPSTVRDETISQPVSSVPVIPSTVKDETFSQSILQQFPEDSTGAMTGRQQARKSSNAISYSQPLSENGGRRSEDVSGLNTIRSTKPGVSGDVPPPLNVSKMPAQGRRRLSSSSSSDYAEAEETARRGSVSRTPVGSVSNRESQEIAPGSHGLSSSRQGNRASMDKPLPVPPVPSAVSDAATSRHLPTDKDYLVKDAAVAPVLAGVVDLNDTEDTTVAEKWAPAVTHEKVTKEIHHIRDEVTYREIHTHDVYHRILPIIDIEVLPPRHFVPVGDGSLIEISASEIPGRSNYSQEWFIAETLSKLPSYSNPVTQPRQFTAVNFSGTDGDYKEYVSELGIPTKETTWVHPPTIADYGREAGTTQPFYFGSANPADDGLRTRIQEARVVGTSKVFAEERKATATLPTESMKDLSLHDKTSGVRSGGLREEEGLLGYEKNKQIGHL